MVIDMKVTVYSCREFDEKELFIQYGGEMGIELVLCQDAPCMDNVRLAEGSDCIDILTSKMTKELLAAYKEAGVRYLVTRTIGYDHIDMDAAKELGITVANAPYGYMGGGLCGNADSDVHSEDEKNHGAHEYSRLYVERNPGAGVKRHDRGRSRHGKDRENGDREFIRFWMQIARV